jgi:hypothetical protein
MTCSRCKDEGIIPVYASEPYDEEYIVDGAVMPCPDCTIPEHARRQLEKVESVAQVVRGIKHNLQNLKHRQTGESPKFNSYAYAEIPDWQLRQWLAALSGEGEG